MEQTKLPHAESSRTRLSACHEEVVVEKVETKMLKQLIQPLLQTSFWRNSLNAVYTL